MRGSTKEETHEPSRDQGRCAMLTSRSGVVPVWSRLADTAPKRLE
jgi:hypothetical protein